MKFKQYAAFTLLEFIIAGFISFTLLLGIVLLNNSLQKNAHGFANMYFVKEKTRNAIKHITTAASLAVGTPLTPGIIGVKTYVVDGVTKGSPAPGVNNTFCIHQNIDFSDMGWPGTIDLTKNRWLCYTPMNGEGGDYNIYWCTKNLGAYNASNASNVQTNALSSACPAVPSKSIGTTKAVSTSFKINKTVGSEQVLFEITIGNCLNPADNFSCTSAPINSFNPYVTEIGSAVPVGHSIN